MKLKTIISIAILAGAALGFAAPTLAAPGKGGSIGFQGVVATLANDAGGTINFTSYQCKSDPDTYTVYGRASTGETITGCWIGDGQSMAIVKWDNGKLYTYPMDEFHFTKEFMNFTDGKK